MSELLKIVLSLSLSGTLLFFIVLTLKPLYKNKLSKPWQYYVWLIVVVRMLIPFTPETTLVGSAFQHLENINVATIQTAPSTNDTQANFDSDENYRSPNGQPQAPQSNMGITPSISIQAIFSKIYENLWILWAAIAFALLIRKITMYQSFVHFVKAGRAEVFDIKMLNTLADVGESIGVKRPVELFTNPLISSPMLLGFLRPYIILPSIELERTELAYIMRHELTHYKHMDMFYKWFVQLTVCLHWFNPFAYLLAKEINKFCELSCDEAIIRTMDTDAKKAYGDTLLNSLKTTESYNDKLATVTLTEGAEQLKERLDAIIKFKKKSKTVIAITLVLTGMLCIGATTIGAYAAPAIDKDNVINTTVASSKVIREGGVYYILCDGADESDKPISGVTEGSIKFVLVRKDGYTSINGFNDIEKLINEVEEQCEYLLKKQLITHDEAMLIVEIATKIQSGNDSDFIERKVDISQVKEYEKWGLEKKNSAYHYNNKPVRILMDLRADNSFANFSYNENGGIDLRLVRNANDSIVKVEYMSKAEADEILSDLEQNPSAKEDIKRLTLEEVPETIQSAVNSCDDKTWYVIDGDGRQYIYYNNLPHNYAYQYEANQNSITIVDVGKSTGNYVLLSVPQNSNLIISYNSKSVTYKTVLQTPSLVPKRDSVKINFSGVSVTGQGPVGVELVRSQNANVTFEFLNLDNEKSCTTKADIVDGTMQIAVNNYDPNGINVNFGPDYKNVVRVYIPDAIYTKFDIQSTQMVVKMQDFNAPVNVESNHAGFWLIDTTISQGTYNIKVSSGPIYIEADTILKDITANADNGPITVRFNKMPTNLYLKSTNCGPVVERPSTWPALYKIGSETPQILLSNTGKAVIEVQNDNQ